MEAHRIVPDLLDVAPVHVATVKYATGASMNLGDPLTPRQVADAPIEITWPDVQPSSLYTILFVDLDAPSRALPAYREIIHWLVVNIPGTEVAKGQTVFSYHGSGAPEGTGAHRYVLLVLEQGNTPIDASSIKSDSFLDRFKFQTRPFLTKYKLTPVAANLFNAQCDDLVRERRAGLLATGFTKHQVVPDVIDSLPKYCAEVVYPPGRLVLEHGGELKPVEVKDIPAIVAWPSEPKTLYTLLFVDPDAPSRTDPSLGQFLHWQVVNIPGNEITKGDTIAEFIGSGPPKDTGLHRYVYLVYKQPGTLSLANRPFISNRSTEGRTNFSVRNFVREYNLGEPIAGSLYQAQYDDYVPVLHKQLGFGG